LKPTLYSHIPLLAVASEWLWLGKGVELEDWMVEDLARDPSEWPFYIAKITKSSLDQNRLVKKW
jgi:hypothetical protein